MDPIEKAIEDVCRSYGLTKQANMAMLRRFHEFSRLAEHSHPEIQAIGQKLVAQNARQIPKPFTPVIAPAVQKLAVSEDWIRARTQAALNKGVSADRLTQFMNRQHGAMDHILATARTAGHGTATTNRALTQVNKRMAATEAGIKFLASPAPFAAPQAPGFRGMLPKTNMGRAALGVGAAGALAAGYGAYKAWNRPQPQQQPPVQKLSAALGQVSPGMFSPSVLNKSQNSIAKATGQSKLKPGIKGPLEMGAGGGLGGGLSVGK